MKTYNSKDPFIVKCFEACTSHISKEDDKLLKRDDCPVSCYNYEYGCLVYTGYPDEHSEYSAETLKKAGFTEAFANLVVLAQKSECKFLQLDCDGVEYEDLPTFSW